MYYLDCTHPKALVCPMSSDISAIREQLLAQANSLPEPPRQPPSSSPALPSLEGESVTWQSPQRIEMLQALRQRSAAQSSQWPTPEEAAAQAAPLETPPEPVNIHRYLQRLHSEAERINELYHQQEAAIRKFHSSVNGLSLILMKQPNATMLRAEQFCEIRDAALTTVMQDEHNRYILTAVDLDLNLDEQQASATAASLRARTRGSGRVRRRSMWASATQSVQGLSGFWHSLTTTLENQSQITPLDILVWCGGGIIGRLALDLLLAASPGLWPWVIGITIGAVVLGLYRLLLAPRTDVAFIARLFLVLLGLGIGGQI